MLKTKKSKQNVTILVLSVMLAIAAIFGLTAAWFISSDTASGSVGTGSVTVELFKGTTSIKGSTSAFTVTDAVAGDNILGDTVKVKATAVGTGVYLRAKITVDVSKAAGATKLTDDDFTLTMASGWGDKQADGYYYYGTDATTLTEISETDAKAGKTVELATALKIVDTSNAQSNTGVTVTIVVEGVQSANNTSKAWANS